MSYSKVWAENVAAAFITKHRKAFNYYEMYYNINFNPIAALAAKRNVEWEHFKTLIHIIDEYVVKTSGACKPAHMDMVDARYETVTGKSLSKYRAK